MNIYEEIIKKLKENNKSISTMESCTGGALASEITNHNGASEVLKFSAVTYSNEYKIKMGVNEKIIDKYSVYSMETAVEMAKNISLFANSNYGVGITGKLNNPDPANPRGEIDQVFIAIFDKDNDSYCKFDLKADKEKTRKENKEKIIEQIGTHLLELLNK